MTIQSRSELKGYFQKNAIPTQGHFEALIDSPVNQEDDGLTKHAGLPLRIEAASTGIKTAITFHEAILQDPVWSLSLLRSVGNPAFTLTDGANNPRLYIETPSGNMTVAGRVFATGGFETASSFVTGALTASGLVTANAGLTVAAGTTTTGVLNSGAHVASGLITANAGLTVAAGTTTTGALNSGAHAASGLITANAGLTVTSGNTTTKRINSEDLTASGLITANAGLTVATGATSTVALTTSGLITANAGLTVATGTTTTGVLNSGAHATSGLITANAGLTVAAGATSTIALTASGLITANAGLTVATGTTTTGVLNSAAHAASGLITANAGLTVSSGALTANGGIQVPVSAGLFVAGPTHANGGLSVTGGEAFVVGLTASGAITANAGLTVTSGTTTTGVLNSAAHTASGLITANAGLTVASGVTTTDTLSAGSILTSGTGTLGASRYGVRLDRSASQGVALPSIPATTSFAGGLMLQAWIYLYSLDGNRIIQLCNGSVVDDIEIWTYADGSYRGGVINTSALQAAVTAPAGSLTINTWIHVAMTVDNSGNAKLFKNGVQVGSNTVSIASVVQRNSNYIGRGITGSYLNGIISDVSVWTGIQTPSMNPPAVNAPGLVGYWKLNDLTGTTAVDSCTNAAKIGSGTLTNGATFASGNALTWDLSQRVTISPATIMQEGWRKPDNLTSNWIQHPDATMNPVSYFKDSCGMVHVRGLVKSGLLGEATAVFYLPVGYRPAYREVFAAYSLSAGGASVLARVDVKAADGAVTVMLGDANLLSLDGITFRAAS